MWYRSLVISEAFDGSWIRHFWLRTDTPRSSDDAGSPAASALEIPIHRSLRFGCSNRTSDNIRNLRRDQFHGRMGTGRLCSVALLDPIL